jgi:hypothetical protein
MAVMNQFKKTVEGSLVEDSKALICEETSHCANSIPHSQNQLPAILGYVMTVTVTN